VTVVIGVDGAGRTHRLSGIAAAAGGPVVRIAAAGGAPPDLPARLADARIRGALVVVDDAHRLDPASLSALAAAVHDGLSVAVSRRPTITSPELAALDEAAAAGGVEHLGPLSISDLTVLVGSVTGGTPSAESVAAVAVASGGWAAVAAAVAAAPGRSPVLAARVHRRLAVLAPGTAALARVLALRLDLADTVLAAASGLDRPDDGLRALREEGFLAADGDRMVPAVAEAVLGELSPAELRRVHEAVATALAGTGAGPVVTATHLRTARARTPAAAAAYRAAGDAVRFADPAAAVDWYDEAADAGAEPAGLAAGRAEAATLLGLAVDLDVAADVADAARLAVVSGVVAGYAGRTARAADALLTAGPLGAHLAVPALIATGRPAEAAAVLAGGSPAGAGGPTGGSPADAGSSAGAGGPAGGSPAGAAGAPAGTTGATGARAGGAGVPGVVRRLAEAAVAATDPAAALPLLIEAAEAAERVPPAVLLPDTPHATAALVAVAAGDTPTAERLLERALAAGVGGPAAADRHRLLLAWARLRAGRYDTAQAELARLTTGPGLGERDRLLLAAVQAGIARRAGDIARIRDTWATVEPVLARRAVDLFHAEVLEELAVAAARLRQQHRIAPVLDTLDEIVGKLGDPPAWAITAAWTRLQLAIAAEDAKAATAIATSLPDTTAPRQQAQQTAAARWAEVLAGDVDPDAVLAAADTLATHDLPWEASRLSGQAAIRTTDPAAARRLLEHARELSQPEAASTPATPAAAERPTGLSEREAEVARLVLAGRTHRDIGAQLYISPKTVEHHVARIRTKLGATTRAEFVAALREVLNV
jgi:DNA-binding NarL/FixJ family response regulator